MIESHTSLSEHRARSLGTRINGRSNLHGGVSQRPIRYPFDAEAWKDYETKNRRAAEEYERRPSSMTTRFGRKGFPGRALGS